MVRVQKLVISAALWAAFLTFTSHAAAQATSPRFVTIHHFTGVPNDGASPLAALVVGSNGVLYGTTYYGGQTGCGGGGCGTAFSLTPPGTPGGAWTETVYLFPGKQAGKWPDSQFVMSNGGVLYGTTWGGGSCPYTSGCGTVFALAGLINPGGSVTEHALYRFGGIPDGYGPIGLVMASNGVLYGTTQGGGVFGILGLYQGTVFSLTPPASPGGAWTESVLHSFGSGDDGEEPRSTVVIDSAGVLYGTTSGGGAFRNGTVFSLTPPAPPGGAWTENVLYSFSGGADGGDPLGGVLIAAGGVLYGTTALGGLEGGGTVFSLSPPAVPGGPWTETVLHSFTDGEGGAPQAGVVMGSGGVLYGTNGVGGAFTGGTIFSLTPPASPGGAWSLAVLYNFTGDADGTAPNGLVIGSDGVLYGTTFGGGRTRCNVGCGTVFALKP